MLRTLRILAIALGATLWLAPASQALATPPVPHGAAPAANAGHADDGHADDGHAAAAHGDDHAGGHGEPAGVIPTIQQGLIPMITSLVVFGIVFFILSTRVWPIITKGLKERENKILQEIEAAEEARRQAKDALESYERSLAEARGEAQKMLEETRGQQQQFAAELKAKAETEVAQLRERAMRDIESAKKTALGEIYAEAASLATMVAGKILQREVSADDQARLVEESLAELRAN
ncbi:MAG: F0F1 ATP synthase subunit B [Phycisphaeraceae bacterium]|nr:F0F1 ATP synthase subunit B [Phycisphaeraceae bacterium]